MEGVSVSPSAQVSITKREFKMAAVCLYLAAKTEDAKYPFFECYKNLLLDKTKNNPHFQQQIFVGFRSQEDLMDVELFIWRQLNFNMNVPVSLKFYERFARCAFPSTSPT